MSFSEFLAQTTLTSAPPAANVDGGCERQRSQRFSRCARRTPQLRSRETGAASAATTIFGRHERGRSHSWKPRRDNFHHINKMESLFGTNYANTQPLRKYEPLIRFDLDGNPQPRKLFDAMPSVEEKKVEVREQKPGRPKVAPQANRPHDDLKRKVEGQASGPEPKKKPQKQASIMSFFAKKPV